MGDFLDEISIVRWLLGYKRKLNDFINELRLVEWILSYKTKLSDFEIKLFIVEWPSEMLSTLFCYLPKKLSEIVWKIFEKIIRYVFMPQPNHCTVRAYTLTPK